MNGRGLADWIGVDMAERIQAAASCGGAEQQVSGPRKRWTLPIGQPNVGLTVTLSYGDPGRRWGACWYGRGVSGRLTPWGALCAAWRFRRADLQATVRRSGAPGVTPVGQQPDLQPPRGGFNTPPPALPRPATELGWWVVSGDNLLGMLRRAHGGDDPDLLYAEAYANSKIEQADDE